MATQTLRRTNPNLPHQLRRHTSHRRHRKDIVLHIIGQIGTAGATEPRHRIRRLRHRNLSMEGRMTICNMSIEAGARAGMIAPDATTFAYSERSPLLTTKAHCMGEAVFNTGPNL